MKCLCTCLDAVVFLDMKSSLTKQKLKCKVNLIFFKLKTNIVENYLFMSYKVRK